MLIKVLRKLYKLYIVRPKFLSNSINNSVRGLPILKLEILKGPKLSQCGEHVGKQNNAYSTCPYCKSTHSFITIEFTTSIQGFSLTCPLKEDEESQGNSSGKSSRKKNLFVEVFLCQSFTNIITSQVLNFNT